MATLAATPTDHETPSITYVGEASTNTDNVSEIKEFEHVEC